MWETPVPIFDDEDENELITKFVELSARYDGQYSPMEITAHIFKNLRDPFPRANQAAMQWGSSLDILERIRLAKLNGGTEPEPPDNKTVKLKKLEAIYNNDKVGMKERIAAIKLHAEIAGEIGGDGDNEDGVGRRAIVINYGIDPRSQANAA
jgi:hypothetical protein